MTPALFALALATALWSADGDTSGVADVHFPFDLAIRDPDSKEGLPPCIVMFKQGRDETGKDVRGPIGRLKALRGASKMFPESNDDPGLAVVMRGLRFHQVLDGGGKVAGYELELLGEYNSIKVPVSFVDMQKLLAGKAVTFTLKAEKNFGLYSYVSTLKMAMQLAGQEAHFLSIDGDFSFREGFATYTSKSTKLTPKNGRKFLYRGERAELPSLPVI